MPENYSEKKEEKMESEEHEEKEATKSALGIDLAKIVDQVKHEYDLAYKHQAPEKAETLVRLRLFNNQKKDKKAVGNTTMFSIFQTVLASLYTDRLMVDFRGREDGDEETANNLNAMARYDYDDMQKDQTDYDWIWDTCFFGRGLLLVEEFERDADKNIFYPVPEVLDPATFLRDPAANSVNGNRKGKGAMRFGGNEIKMTREEMESHPLFFKDIAFETLKYGSGTYSLLSDTSQARDDAQNNQSTDKDSEENLGVNAQYSITQWWTHAKVNGKVKKIKVWLADDRSLVVGVKVYERDYFPIIDRPLYPTSHNWRGTSIPDLTEDKQRGMAIAQNLSLKAMEADLYPMYVYSSTKIPNKSDLDFEFNKMIGIDTSLGESIGDAIQPMNKSNPNLGLLQFIYESLNISAQVATATPDIKMGMQSEANRPLGETNLVQANSDTRYSLGAKVFGWSEKMFWQHWYGMYKDNFADDIDEKVLRIVGAFGSKWRPLTKKEFICRLDPDVYIESQVVSRAKDLEDRTLLTQFFLMALAEPTANRRWGMKKLAKLNRMEKDEIDRLFPPTIDERIAEDENVALNNDKLVRVKPDDDHNTHLEVHASAKDTDATRAHIETHKKALTIKKTNPEWFPADQVGAMMNSPEQGGGQMPTGMPSGQGAPSITPSQTSNAR